MEKEEFEKTMVEYTACLQEYVLDDSSHWVVKGFIDTKKNIFTISKDTKIISKILEIHLFPVITKFANNIGFDIILPEHQNYYPDMTFISRQNPKIKYAVDIKTTYRKMDKTGFCNGFTLGSHGEYFTVRTSKKNIQFPYGEYKGHFCLGIIYTRNEAIDEAVCFSIEDLNSITSVIKDISFFFVEKWKIASDTSGSGNTANIGSITNIDDLLHSRGIFAKYSENIFDEYWINYGKITVVDEDGNTKKIKKLKDFLLYRGKE